MYQPLEEEEEILQCLQGEVSGDDESLSGLERDLGEVESLGNEAGGIDTSVA